MDVNYLFLCSQENQKREASEVEKLKEMVHIQGLQLGTLTVGEAAAKMRKKRYPEEFYEVN